MGILSSLRRDQKEAAGLLQIGTFLEYFDLMLYVHMAVLLNGVFFPETDPHTAALLSAFAFCSTYVLRPFGALLFGYIGDHVGRKATVIITTMMMAVSCIVMATLPTYAQIGIVAAWLMTLCRVLQGLSSMGEIVGAEIYLTEITTPPVRYPVVSLVGCSAKFGIMAALGVATLSTSYGFNWRNAFWIGAVVALVGSTARTRLRETPDFVDMKRRMKKATEESKGGGLEKAVELLKSTNLFQQQKVNRKTILAFFMLYMGPPVCMYFSYLYCGDILKKIGQTGEQVIIQNFIVSIIEFIFLVGLSFLSYKVYPLKILKVRAFLFIPFLLVAPYVLTSIQSVEAIFIIQAVSVCLTLIPVPAVAVFFVYFPVLKRFTYISFLYALTRALMYIVTSFGLVYLTEFFGYWAVWFIMFPVTIGFIWGVFYFEKLESLTNHQKEGKNPAMSSSQINVS